MNFMLRHTHLFAMEKVQGVDGGHIIIPKKSLLCTEALRENFDEDFMNIEVTSMFSRSNNALYMRKLMRKQRGGEDNFTTN